MVECRDTDVVVIVDDDERGFDQAKLAASTNRGHFGLMGMRERATMLGGCLTIESSSSGTSMFVTVPLAAASSDVT